MTFPEPAIARNFFFFILIFLLGLSVNIIIGAIGSGMAKKRGLNPVPAFFAAFFGSFVALFYIAMHPKKDSDKNYPL